MTAQASTFTRPDVLVALGAGLAGVGRTELEALADRFLAERAVSVVADRILEERRWSTPELLAVEQRLVTAATGRMDEQVAVASHHAVREALAAHPTAGQDQAGMVRDVCQGGAGVHARCPRPKCAVDTSDLLHPPATCRSDVKPPRKNASVRVISGSPPCRPALRLVDLDRQGRS